MVEPVNPAATQVTLRPGVGSSYDNGWTQLWRHFWVLLVIGIILFVIGMAFNMFDWVIRGSIGNIFGSIGPFRFFFFLFSLAFGLLVGGPISYGMQYAYLKAARGENVEVGDMFEAFKNYWHAVAASILVGLIVFLGFICLIIPGIFFSCKLAFVPYLVVDRKMSATKAIDESWHMTDGHAWKVFLMGLLAIPIYIAGFICLGIGLIISAMWVTIAAASLYHAVSLEKSTSQPQPLPF